MPTIGIWVSKEVKEAWDILNKIDKTATRELKKALYQILDKHKDVIAKYKDAQTEGERINVVLDALASVTQEEVVNAVSEI